MADEDTATASAPQADVEIPQSGAVHSVPIDSVRANPVALRSVNRGTESYLGLVDSIKSKGFFGAITVRENIDSTSGEKFFELIDGLHRWTASKDAGLEVINVCAMEASELEALEIQLMGNFHRVDTKPADYASHLKRMLAMSPTMTETDLADKLSVSPQFINQRLNLNKITNEEIRKLINDGEITLSNALMLAKLPEEEHEDWVERAMNQPVEEFGAAVNDRAKIVREERRKGKAAEKPEFAPQPHLRKLAELREELEKGEAAARLCEGIDSASGGFAMGVAFALNVDPESLKVQEAKWEQRQAEQEEAKKKRAAERAEKEEKKAKEAMAKAKAAKEEAGLTEPATA